MRKAAAILKDMQALMAHADHEKRDLTAEETAEFDKLKAEHAEAIAAEAAAAERQESETAARRAELEAAQARQASMPVATAGRARPVRAGGAEAVRTFETLGEFVAAVRWRPNDQRLAGSYQEFAIDAEQRMDDGPTGGFMVPEQFRTTIYEQAQGSAIVRPRAFVIPAGTPPDAAITIPALDQRESVGVNNMYGGVQVGYVAGEGGLKPSTTGNFREFKLEPVEWAGLITITDKLLRNWTASSAILTRLMGRAASAFEDNKFLRGTGSGQPLGALVSGARYVVARENANEFSFADYTNMLGRRLLGGSYVWVITLEALPTVMRLRNNEGSPSVGDGSLLFQAGTAGAPDTLGGLPIVWSQTSPALGAEGDIALCDFGEYYIKDGSGPFVAASEHVHFTNNKTVIKMFANHDGQPALTEPLKLDNGYQVSPFVVLSA